MYRTLCTCAIGALALAACGDAYAPSATVEDLEIDVAPSRRAVAPGDTLSIFTRAVNPTDDPIALPWSPCGAVTHRIYDADGERVGPSLNRNCVFIEEPISSIAPRDTVTSRDLWAAVDDWYRAAEPLEPGVYTVVGGIFADGGLSPASVPVQVRVRAKP